MSVIHYRLGSPVPAFQPVWATQFVSDVADGGAGGTYGADGGRYVVGGYADSVVIRASATPAQRAASASDYLRGRAGDESFGFWRDDATGRTWLDVVRTFDDASDAYRAATANGELAVFDTQSGRAIDTETFGYLVR